MEKHKNAFQKIMDNRLLCMFWLIICVAFVTWFSMHKVPFEGIEPLQYSKVFEKTASVIAVYNKKLYYFYVVSTIIAVFLNINYMYRHNGYKGKVGLPLMYASFVCIIMTIIVPHADGGISKIIHWSSALLFAFLNAAALILFLVNKSKENRRYLITLISYCSVPVVMITLLILFGENGAIEILPFWITCLILFLVNFTGFYKGKSSKSINI